MKRTCRLHLFLLLGLLSMALAPLTQAASYKWTDSNGDVHYSQRPPPGKSYEKIKTPKHRRPYSPAAKPASGSAASSSSTDPSEGESKTGDDVLKNEQANNAKIRKKNCEQSKYNLNAFSTYRRIKEPDGTVRTITAEERTMRKKQAEEGIREFCS